MKKIFLDGHSDQVFFNHTSVQMQVSLKFNWKHKINREVFCRIFKDLSFIGKCVGARAEVRSNLVFFLQLSLVHKDQVSKKSESYCKSNT